tara:strand:- start:235 stop:1155 length:921 start_codon:yes stop_codon:yes gene_type:complete
MSDETPTPDVAPAEASSPAPDATAPTESQPQPTALNLDATVRVDGNEVTVGQLVDVAKQAAEIHEYNKHASILMQQNADDSSKETAVRFLMNAEGYTPTQIDEYVNSLQGTPEEPQGEETVTQQQPDPLAQQNDQRIQELEASQKRMNADFLRDKMKEAVSNVMSNNPKIQTLLQKGAEMSPETSEADRLKNIQRQVEASMMENIRARKSRGENFNLSWFSDEGTNAADNIYGRISTVIGDPNKIGRAPETASSVESFFANNKPVEAPEYKSGDNMGSMDSAAREYNVDALSRLAQDLSTGDQSKL